MCKVMEEVCRAESEVRNVACGRPSHDLAWIIALHFAFCTLHFAFLTYSAFRIPHSALPHSVTSTSTHSYGLVSITTLSLSRLRSINLLPVKSICRADLGVVKERR